MKKLFYGPVSFYDDDERKRTVVSCSGHCPLAKWHIKFNGNWWALIMIWDSQLLCPVRTSGPSQLRGWLDLDGWILGPDFSIFFIIKVISADGRTKFIDSISLLALRVSFFFFWSSEHRDGTNKYGYNISIFVQLSFGSNVNHDLSEDFCVCWLDLTTIFPLQSKKRYK